MEMREIKFRIFNKKQNRMVDWSSIPGDYGIKILIENNDDEDFSCWMQYTGLKDKNGKEIYEGDILECHHKIKGNVFFHDGSYGISSEECELNVEDIHTYDNLNVELINDNDLVVIGNIYENPVLLKTK